jgi:hypothetical protein
MPDALSGTHVSLMNIMTFETALFHSGSFPGSLRLLVVGEQFVV